MPCTQGQWTIQNRRYPPGTPFLSLQVTPLGSPGLGPQRGIRPVASPLTQSLSRPLARASASPPATQKSQTHICHQPPWMLVLVRVKWFHFLGCCHPKSLSETTQSHRTQQC